MRPKIKRIFNMAHRLPTITQPAIARALREAKKQGCELMEIKPNGKK
ncbi:putative genomic island protein [Bartonella ancashensis]|uniref:Putative genomic island protein n=1 Tax=Bartonella ancashensis TaxID=1318743 RepID=A0A0M3T2I9_9HYPH|nr:putative genomic island protein [Bartonella ancashensis]